MKHLNHKSIYDVMNTESFEKKYCKFWMHFWRDSLQQFRTKASTGYRTFEMFSIPNAVLYYFDNHKDVGKRSRGQNCRRSHKRNTLLLRAILKACNCFLSRPLQSNKFEHATTNFHSRVREKRGWVLIQFTEINLFHYAWSSSNSC